MTQTEFLTFLTIFFFTTILRLIMLTFMHSHPQRPILIMELGHIIFVTGDTVPSVREPADSVLVHVQMVIYNHRCFKRMVQVYKQVKVFPFVKPGEQSHQMEMRWCHKAN